MVWFKVDDRFHGSDPVRKIPREIRAAAIGVWTLSGAWSAQFLKDGWVPNHIFEDFGGTPEIGKALVRADLWSRGRGGFQFVDWKEWQITREKTMSNREAERQRKDAWRTKNAAKTEGEDASVPVGQKQRPNTPSRPVPSRPDPKTKADITHFGLSSTEIPVRDELTTAAESLGIKDLPRVAVALMRIDVMVDTAECIDVARAILDLSTHHVRYPEKYIERACMKPDEVRILAGPIIARSPRAVLGVA